MKAIIVARVSTEEQREAGNSLSAQLARMQNYCERNNYPIIESYSFDESAYKPKRDEFDKILKRINQSKEKIAVCFDKVDRLSRDIFDKRVALLYEKAIADEIELHFVSDGQVINNNMNAGDKFAFGMKLGLSKYYSDAISDNTRRAFEQKRRNGQWTGPAPTGYKNIPLDVEKRLRKDIVPDPDKAHLVQELFNLHSTGNYSITSLWQKTTQMGLRNKEGKELARSNIAHIIKNPFYYGVGRSRKYGLYNHNHQPLITKALFERCQEVLRQRNKRRSKITFNQFVFQGLLPCADCGCLYSPQRQKGNNYYSCTNAKRICKKVYVNEKVLLEPVKEVFEAFRGIPQEVQEQLVSELRTLNEGEATFHEKEIRRLRAEYDQAQSRIDALLDMRLDQSITKDEYDKKLQSLKDKQYKLNIELDEYTKADHEYHIHVSAVINLSRSIGDIFEEAGTEEKRAILNFLLQNPKMSGKKLDFELKKPFSTVLELADCTTGLRG